MSFSLPLKTLSFHWSVIPSYASQICLMFWKKKKISIDSAEQEWFRKYAKVAFHIMKQQLFGACDCRFGSMERALKGLYAA